MGTRDGVTRLAGTKEIQTTTIFAYLHTHCQRKMAQMYGQEKDLDKGSAGMYNYDTISSHLSN